MSQELADLADAIAESAKEVGMQMVLWLDPDGPKYVAEALNPTTGRVVRRSEYRRAGRREDAEAAVKAAREALAELLPPTFSGLEWRARP